MSVAVLIIGASGTGKSTSIRTLPAKETFILNICDKPLPFRGSKKLYTPLSADGKTGNYYTTDDSTKIMRMIQGVSDKRPDIKYLVLDDFGISITNEKMRKLHIKGWDKFSEIAKNVNDVISLVMTLREDLFVFITMHTKINEDGTITPRTAGKVIDNENLIEGKFTYVFHSVVQDSKYKFITNNDGIHMAKSSMELFDPLIDNDLKFIADKINNYLNEDIEI